MLKKVVPVIVILLFLVALAVFVFSTVLKNSTLTYWGNQTNSNGYWLLKENENVSAYKVLERTSGFLAGYTQDESTDYFLTLKLLDDVTNKTTDVKIPRNMNSDAIKLSIPEIVDEVVHNNGAAISVDIVRDPETNKDYLDYINFIKTQ
ncbi:MAG: hypothetical protein ACMG57_05160 [Candidatus Dojkabacteria bacterium]